MDLDKTYNNRKLEHRRKQLLQKRQAVEVLRQRKERRADNRAQILAAFDGRDLGPLSARIRVCLRGGAISQSPDPRAARDALRRLLLRVHDETYLLNGAAYVQAVLRLGQRYAQWVLQPDDWRARSHNASRQLASLSRHLLACYPVPAFMDAAWTTDNKADARRHQAWFIHIGRGENIRTADDLPVPLTKLMAHHVLLAPGECSIPQALRWGQLAGTGVPERIAHAMLGSRIGGHFADPAQEAFWLSVFQFFARHPMLDPHQVGPVIDYLHHQKFVPVGPVNVGGTFVQRGPAQPGLSMKGRTPETLVAQVIAWHRQLRRSRVTGADVTWASCGIDGYDRLEGEPGNQRRFSVTELLSGAELRAEGAVMKHCVGTYTWSCQSGRTAIYSLRHEDRDGLRHLATIEVDVRTRQITQARTKHNAATTQLDQRIMSAWATTARLSFSPFALTRRY